MKNITSIVFFLLMFCNVNAQQTANFNNMPDLKSAKDNEAVEPSEEVKSNIPISIISTNAEIRTYYSEKTLKEMSKGALVDLYIEHLRVVVKIMPHIALATKPGVTMADLGIPEGVDNRRFLDLENEATEAYLESSKGFLRYMLPYADKDKLVTMILFFEQILKSLREVEQQ